MNGKGQLNYENGNFYKGEFKDDIKHGVGIYTWQTGKKIEGWWNNGKQEGEAKYTNDNGQSRIGIWVDGERKQWLDWISQYGDFLRQKTSTEKKTKEWLSGLINKIIVTPVFGMDRDGNKNIQKGNTFTIIFKMKIVDDKFQYKDPNNKNLGYKISLGKQQKKSIVLDFTTGRGKNKKKV